MAMMVSWWERRDTGDREEFGQAALEFCRASRARDGVRSSRFYWLNLDTIVIATDAEQMSAFDGPPKPEQMGAVIRLSAVARQVQQQRWGDAAAGEQIYRSAQR